MTGPGRGTWVIDLDGVIWLAREPIPGSADAIARLRAAGVGVLFATNNALPTLAELVDQLAAVGIPVTTEDLVTSAQAAASLLAENSRAVVCASGGVTEALGARGVTIVAEGPADAVVVGLTRDFTYDMLATAVTAVRGGARLVGTNDDATYPTPGRLLPGAGALLAAVATAAQKTPEVAGKPHQPVATLIRNRAPGVSMVVGDRPSTDGLLARRLGVRFALVRSGVTGPQDPVDDIEPAVDAADIAAVVDRELGVEGGTSAGALLKGIADRRSVAAMPPNDGLKRYLEAGLALTQITRARAEELVHELIQAGEVETTRAQDWVEDLVKTSRERSDTLLATVRGEVKTQLADLGISNIDDLAHRVSEMLDKAETAARKAANRGPGRGRTSGRSSARTTTAKKAPAKKTAAKKTPAKSAAATKTTTGTGARATKAKKAPAKKTAAKKTATASKKSSTAAKARR